MENFTVQGKYGKIFSVVVLLLQFHAPISFVCLILDSVLCQRDLTTRSSFWEK